MKRKIYYGYIITIAAWLIYFFSTGASSYGTSIVSTRLVLEHGWDQSVIGLSSSTLYLAVALIAVPVSVFEKKRGCRITIILGSLVGMLAYGGLLLFSESQIMYILMFLLLGFCSSACGMTTGPALITSWHRRGRALNMSLFYTSGSIAGFLMPLVAKYLTDINVQLCWIVYFFEALLAFLLAVFVLADRPEDKSEVMDGGTPGEEVRKEYMMESKKANAELPEVSECYHSGRFFSLFFQTFVCRMAHTGIISYITIYAVQKGVDFSIAAVLVTVYSTANLIGRSLIGVSGKMPFKRKTINLIGYTFMVAGAVTLPFVNSFLLIMACALTVGVGQGMSFTIFPILVAECFGDENFMVLNGMYSTLGTSGSVVAPVILLSIANFTGRYDTAYGLIAALCVIALILAVLTPIKMLDRKRT